MGGVPRESKWIAAVRDKNACGGEAPQANHCASAPRLGGMSGARCYNE
jgi:hypothetical protein